MVKKGDVVKKGQVIAIAQGNISAPVHAPTSGQVVGLGRYKAPHPSGLPGRTITIRTDDDEEWCELPEPMDPHQWEGKAMVTKAYQDLSAIIDSAGLCIFFAVRHLAAKDLGVAPVGILEYLNYATDADYTLDELMQAGERIINAERLFLIRAGFARKDDRLPERLTKTPAPTGPAKGLVCHLDKMLDEYYQIRGWTKNGIPGKDVLVRLGLS